MCVLFLFGVVGRLFCTHVESRVKKGPWQMKDEHITSRWREHTIVWKGSSHWQQQTLVRVRHPRMLTRIVDLYKGMGLQDDATIPNACVASDGWFNAKSESTGVHQVKAIGFNDRRA